jgi:serine O-acetyltransferase
MAVRFRQIIAADLLANTGRTGFFHGFANAIINPSFGTVLGYRIAKALYDGPVPILGRLVWRFLIATSGAYISLNAKIGPGLKLPHPIGLSIGNGAVLGNQVTVHQNVSIGRNIDAEVYPVIEDGAVLLANAIITGRVTVGARAIVGGGAVVLTDVPEGAIVSGNPARRVWSNKAAAKPTPPDTPAAESVENP